MAKINSSFIEDVKDTYMISCLSLIFRSGVVLHDLTKVIPSKIDFLSREELIGDLYSGVIVRDKVSEMAEEILDAICKLLEDYSDSKPLNQFKIGKENIVKAMFDHYLKLSYSSDFYNDSLSDKLYETIITIVRHRSFNATNFIIDQAKTFTLMCSIGAVRIVESLGEKIDRCYNNDLLKVLVPNGINAIFFGTKANSHSISYKVILEVAQVLNKIIIKAAAGKNVVTLNIAKQNVAYEEELYLSCNFNGDFVVPNGVDLQFLDGKFQLCDSRIDEYVKLYNFYSGFFLRKLYFAQNITFEQLFPKIQIPHERSTIFSRISSLFSDPPKEEFKFQSEQNAICGINLYLLCLSNKKNQFPLSEGVIDENLTEFFNLFSTLDSRNPLFKSINNATSPLWQNIRMIGSARIRLVLDFFLERGYLENDQHNIACIVTRSIKASLIERDLCGFEMWLDYSLEMSKVKSQDKTHCETDFNYFKNIPFITNTSQAIAIHDAINIAVALNMEEALQIILSKYKNFLGLYRYRDLFSKYTTFPFDIIKQHSRSKLIEAKDFRMSLSKITVLLLEYGYPIELIELCSDLNATSFIKSIVSDQVKYSLKRLALNYLDLLPIPFVNQFRSISRGFLDVTYYLNIYEKSFNFIYGAIGVNKVDISGFCHTFSSILQPRDFLSRLSNISFLSCLKDSFTVSNDHLALLISARNIANLVKDTDLVSEFTLRWNCTMSDRIMEFAEICNYIDEKLQDYKDERSEKLEPIEEVSFFHYIYSKSQEKDPNIALYKMEQANSIEVLSHIGATVITGTFIYFNNPEVRAALITVIPTVYSGLSLAGSISSNILNTLSSGVQSIISCTSDISYSTLYLLFAGITVYAGYKVYSSITSQSVIQLDLEMLERIVDQWQEYDSIDNQFELITSKENIYSVLSNIFKSYSDCQIVDYMRFSSLIERFGITWEELDNALYNLENDTDDIIDGILTVAYTVSLVAIYLNVQKIKLIVDSQGSNATTDFQRLLYDILSGRVTNIYIAISNIGINRKSDDLEGILKKGLPVAIDSYNYKYNDIYLSLWYCESKSTLYEKIIERVNERENDPFLKFILVLNNVVNKSRSVTSEEVSITL
jgi:hypothetical protein